MFEITRCENYPWH